MLRAYKTFLIVNRVVQGHVLQCHHSCAENARAYAVGHFLITLKRLEKECPTADAYLCTMDVTPQQEMKFG